MDFHWVKTGRFIKRIFPSYIWDIPNNDNTVYLTFDDGPTPEITPWVLDLLKEEQIKATFFCIGNNIQKYPEIFNRITSEGHTIGNHTFGHLNGWKTSYDDYIGNIKSCEEIITKAIKFRTGLFRPPYGKIKPSQAKTLRKSGYKIVMWDILTVDYDKNTSPEKCYKNATEKTASGSVIVFHDSVKAFKNLEYALPRTIETLRNKGFRFDSIY